MRIQLDHAEGRDEILAVEGMVITGFGIYSREHTVAKIAVTESGQLAWKDSQGRLLGAITVAES